MGVATSTGAFNEHTIIQTGLQTGSQTSSQPPPQMPQISSAQAVMPYTTPFYKEVRYLHLFILLLACIIVYLLVAGNPYSSGDANVPVLETGLPVK